MEPDDDVFPLSALQHVVFCERQCALIHVEGLWRDNGLTVEGQALHERVDSGEASVQGTVRIVRGLYLRSRSLGLYGRADVVEFDVSGIAFPIDYKRGAPKAGRCDEVQLCAQAICLEEMTGGAVPYGALFYHETRRRRDVAFDDDLRSMTTSAAARVRALISTGVTPRAELALKCRRCSLRELCLPEAMSRRRSASRYFSEALRDVSD